MRKLQAFLLVGLATTAACTLDHPTSSVVATVRYGRSSPVSTTVTSLPAEDAAAPDSATTEEEGRGGGWHGGGHRGGGMVGGGT